MDPRPGIFFVYIFIVHLACHLIIDRNFPEFHHSTSSMDRPIQPKYVNVNVNHIPVRIQADSGSDINLFPKNHFFEYCEKIGYTPKLTPSARPLRAANKTLIPNLGWFTVTLSNKHASLVSRIYVMKHEQDDLPLMSRYDLYQLGYMRIDPDGAFASKKVIQGDLSDQEFQSAVEALHKKHAKVFIGVGLYKHHTVDLKVKEDSEPFIIKAVPCSIHYRKKALERLEYFVKLKILEPLPNGYPIKYCSPMLVLEKPNKKGDIRLVCNFKKLNKILSRTRHVPAVGINDFCRVTSGFQYWFRLDLRHAFHQLEMSPQSQELTIISTFNGCYKWRRMPQGLINAGDYFDQVMEKVMANMTNSISMRDDIIGGGTNRREMLAEYSKVLEALEANGLTCDPTKTQVGMDHVNFYGMVWSRSGMKPDPKKVQIVKNAKIPRNQDELNSWVCMVAWNSTFIHRYAEMVRPLRDLANSKEPFHWKPEHDRAFKEVKAALSEHCLNNYFDIRRTTYLFTDAGKNSFDPNNRNGGFSAILAQQDDNDKFHVIHYSSRSISPLEKKWSQPELEARALRYGIDKFRFYLEGIDVVYCMVDCKALIPLWNNNNKECPPRIDRQRLATQDISTFLIHLEGKKNPADWASRSRCEDDDDTHEDLEDMNISDELDDYVVKQISVGDSKPIAIDTIREHTEKDPILKLVKERIQRNDWKKYRNDKRIRAYFGVRDELSIIDDIIFRGSHRIVLPEALHSSAISLVHSLSHQGMTNTERLFTNRLWFPGYSVAIRTEIDMCEICKHTVVQTRQEPGGGIAATTPSRPFEEVSVDFKGKFHDNFYCLAFLDIYTKWPSIFFTTSTSFAAVKKHFLTYFSHHGYPRIIKSDSGPPFNGSEFKEFLAGYGIRHLPVIPETPWANEVENFNKLIRKAYDIARLKKWDYKEFMTQMVMVRRATPSSATKVSPHFAATGRILDPGILQGSLPLDPSSGLSREEQKKIQENLIQSKLETKKRHDAKRNVVHLELKPNDVVLVRLGNNRIPEKDKYVVVNVKGNEITAKNVNSGRILRRHLSRFTKVMEKPQQTEVLPPQQPEVSQQFEENDQHHAPSGVAPVAAETLPPPPEQQQQRDRNDRNDLPQQRVQQQRNRNPQQRVRFNERTHTLEYNTGSTIAPARTTRQEAARIGIPVPNHPLPNSALESSVQARTTAQQLQDQYQQNVQQALRLDRPVPPPPPPGNPENPVNPGNPEGR